VRRTQDDDLLDYPLRKSILNAVASRRFATASSLARALGVSRATTRHHLARIENAGLVRSAKLGRQRVYVTTSNPTGAVALSLLSTPACSSIVLDIIAHPGSVAREVGARTGLTRRVVHHHAKRLHDAGFLAVEGEPYRFTASRELVELVSLR
jgi:DNA-binding transcriptional ArsR family regulator